MPDQVDWRTVEREANPGRAVGRLLRDQREALGLGIGDVARRLRIRRPYVEAIEAGDFHALPGAAYVPAFLRTYASHLGLNSAKVLEAYQSAGAVPIERPTALPTDFPIVEKRSPVGLVVLTALFAIGGAYALWHYAPREQTVVAEKVPPVPDRLMAARPTPTEPARVAPEPWPTPRTEPTASSVVPSVPPPTAVVVVEPPVIAVAPPAMSAPIAAPTSQPTPVAVAVPVPAPASVAATVGKAQAAQPPADPTRVDVLRGGAQPTVETQEAVQRTPPAEDLEARIERVVPVRRDTTVAVRVDSWIELRAPNGDLLAQTYVRAGETYTVPAGIAYRVTDAR